MFSGDHVSGTAARVVVAEALADDLAHRLAAIGPVHEDANLWRNRPALMGALAHAEALLVRNQTRVDAELLAAAPGLRVVGRWGVGLDNLDLDALGARGIQVIAAGAANASAVAEYVVGAMLAVARQFVGADARVRAGYWERQRFGGTELGGKTLGLVGFGEIARRVAARVGPFDMRVLAYDPYLAPNHPSLAAAGASLVPLDDLLAQADYVSLHVPLTPETRSLIGARALRRMKPTAVVVNTSRGGVVDEAALAEHLRRMPTFSAVLDVREQEPPVGDDPFRSLSNVLLTPHVAGLTAEAAHRVGETVIAGVLEALGRS